MITSCFPASYKIRKHPPPPSILERTHYFVEEYTKSTGHVNVVLAVFIL